MKKGTSCVETEDTDNEWAANKTTPRVAKVGLGIASAALAATVGLSAPFLRRYSGAPYVSSAEGARRAIVSRLQLEATKRGGGKEGIPYDVVDLGSGSGDVLLDAAQQVTQVRATGYELNTWLVLLSRWRAYRMGVAHRVHFVTADFWNAPLGRADAVVVFGVPDIMDKVARKIAAEAPHGCLVASNTFQVGSWRPLDTKSGVWFYRVGVSNYNSSAKNPPEGDTI